MISILKQYFRFLARSAETLEHDISQPYHKVIDLILKLVSLGLAAWGAYLLFTSTSCYFSPSNVPTIPVYCAPVLEALEFGRGHPTLFQVTLMQWLEGAGALLVALFISQVLVVRHLNETLPDHIYLRCFATEEEKQRRLPIKEKKS